MLSFNQSSPSYDIVCPGDTLVFTCITSYEDGFAIKWSFINFARALTINNKMATSPNGHISIKITEINNITIISTATFGSALLLLNGTVVRCSGNEAQYTTLTVHIAGKISYIMNHMYHNTVSMYRCTSISY